MNLQEFQKELVANRPSENVIINCLKMREKYRLDVKRYAYPSKPYYISIGAYWLCDMLRDNFGFTMPYFISFLKDGKGEYEWAEYLGFAEKVMENIISEKDSFLDKHKKYTNTATEKFEQWLLKQKVDPGKPLQEYINRLKEAALVLCETAVHFQISFHINYLLQQKIIQIAREVGVNENLIMGLAVAVEKADAVIHEDAVIDFIAWCKKKNITLLPYQYDSLLKNNDFKEKLEDCYKKGYFLRVSYGGVTLWTLHDEYTEIVKISQENISMMHPPEKVDIRLSAEQEFWIKVSQYFSFLRDRRKTIQQKSFYYQIQIMEEISKCVSIPRTDLEYLLLGQFDFLSNLKKTKILIEQQKEGVLLNWNENDGIYFKSGKGAVKKYEEIKLPLSQDILLKGQSACSGIARGRVRKIFNTHEKYIFNEGDVLVTGMTSPDFFPLMKRAAAIVTDLGGITCHAAILARELGKPCIVGTEIATNVLKDGELVEVDADNGVVRRLQ